MPVFPQEEIFHKKVRVKVENVAELFVVVWKTEFATRQDTFGLDAAMVVGVYWSDVVSDEINERQEFYNAGGEDPLLVQPSLFLAILAESLQDDIVFFTHDMSGILTYLSPSAERVLNQDPRAFIRKPISDVLTDNPCNDSFKGFGVDSATSPESGFLPSPRVEIRDSNGNQHQLEYWKTTMLREGRPVGVSGILRRVDSSTPRGGPRLRNFQQMLDRARTLSEGERQVIDRVVQGEMNKKIANDLKLAERTIEARRQRAMQKLQAKTIPELVWIWMHIREKLN